MNNILVYGSLMNLEEISKLGLQNKSLIPVKLMGHQRAFNQEPSWRKVEEEKRAVLNVINSSSNWFNGIIITGLTEDILVDLDKREMGYNRVNVDMLKVSFYDSIQEMPEGDTWIYAGKPEKRNVNILPGAEYLKICIQGAGQWGDFFLEDFFKTTFVKERIPLKLDFGTFYSI